MKFTHKPAAIVLTLALGLLATSAIAQKELQPEDYGKWENLGRAVLSPDGRWLAVRISRVDGTSWLEVRNLQSPADPVILEEGNSPAFSGDSKWLAYSIGYSTAEQDKLRAAEKPIRLSLGLRELDSGTSREYANVERFSFSEGGVFLVALQYKPDGQSGDETRPAGGSLMVIHPTEDSAITLGSVTEFAWQPGGSLIALAVQVESGPGNGVQLFDAAAGGLRVLDSGDAEFTHLAWRKEADDLAYFRKVPDEEYYEDNHRLVVWRGLNGSGTRFKLDLADHSGLREARRIVAGAGLQWTDDGDRVFLRIQEWVRKPEPPAKKSDEKSEEETADEVERSDVQIWHTRDERIFPMQELQKNRDRNRGLLTSWDLDTGRLRVLGTDIRINASVSRNGRLVIEEDERPYTFGNQFDTFGQSDIRVVDLQKGTRTKVVDGVWHFYGSSPQGRYLLYFQNDDFWTFDVKTGAKTNLTKNVSDFVNREYDTPVREQRPPWGVGGWMADDGAVLLNDRYDVWWVPPNGKNPSKLTAGTEHRIVHRVLNLNLDRDPFDPAETLYFRTSGEWSKQSGFTHLKPADRAKSRVAERLLQEDSALGGLIKAEKAPVLAFTKQAFDDSPDYFVARPDLSDARQVTNTNKFQSEYAWGRAELIEYASEAGKPLQGALYYPAGYVEGRTYPMIVYVYERRAQLIHSYRTPSERSSYNTTVWTTQGYFVLEPDIVFRDREPGISAVECVRPAVQAVIEKGAVDAKRVGLVGHSWGGYEASFIPTQTDIFATSIAGAPLTNFFSMFGTIHWNQGRPESSHFETGQARMEVPYWEDMEAYVRNSPVMHLQTLNTPMLIFFGDKDGTVDWHQGVEMYNYARRAGKFLVMLVYPGENHSAREKENQIDYHHRIRDWFGHFLKGEEAATWITEGVPALERERWLKETQR